MAYPLFHPESSEPAPLLLDAESFRRSLPGESRHVEFKQGASHDRIARAVTAFSNTDGGVVVVGLAPDGRPVGTAVDGEALAKLHRAVGSVHDAGRYTITSIDVGERSLAVISIARRREGFAQTPDAQVVVRRDAMNAALIGAELADFVTRNALVRFETTQTSCSVAAADPELLEALGNANGWSTPSAERLIERGLLLRERGRELLTVAGALYLLAEPERELGKTYIEVFRYRDDASTSEDKRYRITGPLPR